MAKISMNNILKSINICIYLLRVLTLNIVFTIITIIITIIIIIIIITTTDALSWQTTQLTA